MKIVTKGILTEIVEKREFEVQNINDIHTLIASLSEKYPKLTDITYTIVVNDIVINGNTKLVDSDIIQIIPIFEGG